MLYFSAQISAHKQADKFPLCIYVYVIQIDLIYFVILICDILSEAG